MHYVLVSLGFPETEINRLIFFQSELVLIKKTLFSFSNFI